MDKNTENLSEHYQRTIYDKIALLTRLIAEVQKHPDETSLFALQSTLHKIGGSAGSFGYPKVTELCFSLEHDVGHKLKTKESITEKWLRNLDTFLNEIRRHFMLPFPDADHTIEGMLTQLKKEKGYHELSLFPDLMAKLNTSLENVESLNSYLALFEIDNFSNLSLKDTEAAHRLLVWVNNGLIDIVNEDISCFLLPPSKFAIHFQNKEIKFIENKLKALLRRAKGKADAQASFSCGVVTISNHFATAQEILHAAEMGIAEIRQKNTVLSIKISVNSETKKGC